MVAYLNTVPVTFANGKITFFTNGVAQFGIGGTGTFQVDGNGNVIFTSLVPAGDDIQVESDLRWSVNGMGPVVIAPNNSKWRLKVDNAGNVSAEAA